MEAKDSEAGEVDSSGASDDVGEHPAQPSRTGLAPAPGLADEMADLWLHFGVGGLVGLLPLRGVLGRLVALEDPLVAVDGDRPAGFARGASCEQRAGCSRVSPSA